MDHRKDIQSLTAKERKKLAELILMFLTQSRITNHMLVDHLGRFFTHHRAYIFGLENFIKGHARYQALVDNVVPLPFWDARNKLPSSFGKSPESVAPNDIPRGPYTLANPIVTDTRYLFTRYRGIPFPDNSGLDHPENFDTAEKLSLALGRDLADGPITTITHYHGQTHASLGGVFPLQFPPVTGPFLNMQNTAAPFIFWPLHAFFDQLYHRWEEAKLGRLTSPVIYVNKDNQLELFCIGNDGKLWHTWNRGDAIEHDPLEHISHHHAANSGGPNTDDPSFGNWDHWSLLDGSLKLKKIVVGKNLDGRLELFGISDDGTRKLYHKGHNSDGTWSQWVDLGGDNIDVSVTNHTDGRLAVFTIQKDKGVYIKSQEAPNGGWPSTWKQVMVPNQMNVHAILQKPGSSGRIHALSVDKMGRVWHRYESNADWNAPGEQLINDSVRFKTIAVGVNKDSRIEIFGIGRNGKIYHSWQTSAGDNNTFSNWEVLDDNTDNTELAVGRNDDGRLEIFFGNGIIMKHLWQVAPNSGRVSNAEVLKMDAVMGGFTQPFCFNDTKGRLMVFNVASVDGLIWHAWQPKANVGPWMGWLVI